MTIKREKKLNKNYTRAWKKIKQSQLGGNKVKKVLKQKHGK